MTTRQIVEFCIPIAVSLAISALMMWAFESGNDVLGWGLLLLGLTVPVIIIRQSRNEDSVQSLEIIITPQMLIAGAFGLLIIFTTAYLVGTAR